MSATRTKQPRLSDEDVGRVIALLKDSDSVELKLTVPATDHRATAVALGLDPLEAQIRPVFFFDTPHLDLNGRQETKTKAALTYFSKQLRAAASS